MTGAERTKKATAARWAGTSPEERSAWMRRCWDAWLAKTTPRERAASARHAARARLAAMAPEQRSELARKMARASWAKLTAKQRGDRAAHARAGRVAMNPRRPAGPKLSNRECLSRAEAKALAWLRERGYRP